MEKTYKSGDFEYKIIDDNQPRYIKLMKFLNKELKEELVVPSQIDGLNVRKIGDQCFYRCNITSLVLPSSVVNIKQSSFMDCKSLKKIQFYKSELITPQEVINKTYLSDWLYFYYYSEGLGLGIHCDSLEHLDLSDSRINKFDLDYFSSKSLEIITFPKNPYKQFDIDIEMDYYKSFDLPNLREIIFPNLDIKLEIKGEVFKEFNKLESVTLPHKTILYGEPFNDSVTLTNTKDIKRMPILGATAARWFYPNVVDFISPNNEEEIGSEAFKGFDSLKSVFIKKNIQNVGYETFVDCTNLEIVEVEAESTSISWKAFYGSNNIKTIIIPNLNFLAFTPGLFIPNAKYIFKIDICLFVSNKKNIMKNRSFYTYFNKYKEPLELFGEVIKSNASNVYNIFKEERVFKEFSINTKKYVALFKEILDMDYSGMVKTLADDNKIHKNRINEYIEYARSVNAYNSLLVLMQWKNENIDLEKERKKARKKAIAIMNDPDAILRQSFRFRSNGETSFSIIYKGNDSIINVPDTYKEKSVSLINRRAFFENKNILEVSLPDTIQGIGVEAFLDCFNLKSINFPQYLNYIDENAFNGCQSLMNIEFNENLDYIGDFAFINCSSIKDLVLPDSLETIGKYAFANSSIESVVFPENAPDITVGLFSDCQSLKDVKFPKDIKHIKRRMFDGCTSLESMIIPKTVKKIQTQAFMYCINLIEITIPSSVNQIGHDAFAGCKNVSFIVDEGSYAHRFAQDNNIKFVISD